MTVKTFLADFVKQPRNSPAIRFPLTPLKIFISGAISCFFLILLVLHCFTDGTSSARRRAVDAPESARELEVYGGNVPPKSVAH
jgi:hypothetical protein